MNNRPILLLAITLISLFCVACQADSDSNHSYASADSNDRQQTLPEASATLAGQELTIMLARTFDEKATGLMYYDFLAENHGMLFVYQTPRTMSFWMKNTKIPLDLVFFSDTLEITEWIENMQPGYGKPENLLPRYTSQSPAQYALELPAGSIVRLGLKTGDRLDIPVTLLYSD